MGATDGWPHLSQLGDTGLQLYENSSWIARRVETVRFLDSARIERRVTLDIDSAELCALTGASPGDELLLPLASLPKTLLLDFDLRTEWDDPIAVAVSTEDSDAAKAMLLALLNRAGIRVDNFTPAMLIRLFQIAYDLPSHDDVRTLNAYARGQSQPSHDAVPPVAAWRLYDPTSAEQMLWSRCFTTPGFPALVATVTLRYFPMFRFVLGHGVSIIKYRYVEVQRPPRRRSLIRRLAIGPYNTLVELSAIGYAKREHLRLEAPEGMFIQDCVLAKRLASQPSTAGPQAEELSDLYQYRLTHDRAALYIRDAKKGAFLAPLELRPKTSSFLRSAQFTVVVSFMLLFGGGLAQVLGKRLEATGSSSEAAVALLVVVPSVMAASLAREGEHALLSEVLRLPRFALALSAIAGLAAGAARAINITGQALSIVWLAAAGVCFVVLLLLSLIAALSKHSWTKVQRKPSRPTQERIQIYRTPPSRWWRRRRQ